MDIDLKNETGMSQDPNVGAPAGTRAQEKRVFSSASFVNFAQNSSLAPISSAACRKYCEELTEACTKYGLQTQRIVTNTADALLVYAKEVNFGIVFVFSTATGSRPLSDKIDEVVSNVLSRPEFAGLRILKGYSIDETSYENAPVAAAAAANLINTTIGEDRDELTAESFRDANGNMLDLVVCTRPDVYREYVKRISPFSFSMRDDIGFVVAVPNRNTPQSERFNVSPDTHTILFAVTAYTQFIRQESNYAYNPMGAKCTYPIVHISSIVAQTPTIVFLPPAIAIAARVFIGHRAWTRPYLAINGKEEMNIGNIAITIDPTSGNKQVVDVEQAFQAEDVINNVCAEPVLAIDYTQGRDNLIGLEGIFGTCHSYNGNQPINLNVIMERFFAPEIQKARAAGIIGPSPIQAIADVFFENTGCLSWDNKIVDSRYADYLRCFRKFGDFNRAAPLLSQPNDPAVRMEQLNDLGFSTKCLYKTSSAILTAECVKFLNAICPNYDIDLTNDTRFNFAFSGLGSASGLSSLAFGSAQQQTQTYGRFNTPYGRW